jgi:hypothetical protein
LLHFCAGRSLLIFQGYMLPPSSRHPDGGGSKHLWNVSKFLPDTRLHYTTSQKTAVSNIWELRTPAHIWEEPIYLKPMKDYSWSYSLQQLWAVLVRKVCVVWRFRIKGLYCSWKIIELTLQGSFSIYMSAL